MMINYNFAVFILTHGRADKVITYNTLKRCGYTGRIFLLVDSFDKQVDQYKANYGDQVVVFDKQKAIDMTDSGDTQQNYKTIIYARNYNFVVAKQLGIDYFLQLDDDYTRIDFAVNKDLQYIGNLHLQTNKLDIIFNLYLSYLINSKIKTVAFAQGGDFIGGQNSGIFKNCVNGIIPRKAMNAFFFATDNPVKFMGRINEDVNNYTCNGLKGQVFVTHPFVRIEQLATQQNSGGMTQAYLDGGTYIKSFYSIMYAPSCVKIHTMGVNHLRIHHRVNWNNAVPKIIHPSNKKASV